jgi:uncharacterized membrane protein YcaP (DUF421 family)
VVFIASVFWGWVGDSAGWTIPEKMARTAAIYFAIVLLLRIFGKRELAQLNSFDLVVLLLLSNVVQNAIIGPDTSILGGLTGAFTLLGLNWIVVRIVNHSSEKTKDLFEGHETPIVTDGHYDDAELGRLGLRAGDVETAIRRQGAASVDEVKLASIYPGGAIVVQLNDEDQNATRGDLERLERKLDQLIAAQGA